MSPLQSNYPFPALHVTAEDLLSFTYAIEIFNLTTSMEKYNLL